MYYEVIKKIIDQINKYELTELFSNGEEFQNWTSELNAFQINNFINLNIDIEEIRHFKHLLINKDLLNCEDYNKKVEAISTLKNGDGCLHLFDVICSPNFLKSKKFYKDIEMLSKADTARYGLWILGEDTFINSLYHDEDLKLLVETHDTNKEAPKDFVVLDAIATVAGNIDSINSPHHRADMKLIANAGSDVLQASGFFPESGLNNLAVNKVSLEDKYHLENMQILATNPIARDFLYIIMTEPDIVKGENYRKEVEALVNAKSKATARALYYYILNSKGKYMPVEDFLYYSDCNVYDSFISDKNSMAVINDPDYINNLIKINKVDDKFVMCFVELLLNQNFINSPYKMFDLELLKNTSDIYVFRDLCRLMTDENSLNNIHHKKDAVVISQTMVELKRKLLLGKATDKLTLNSDNHDYDMEYILKLNLDSINETIYNEINYYLFSQKGINDPQRKEKLEKLLQGILVEKRNSKSRILNLFKKI